MNIWLARFRERRGWFLWSLTVLVLDQWTKWLVERHLPHPISREILPGLLHLSHVKNTGAAFGILAEFGALRGPWLLILASIIAMGFVGITLLGTPSQNWKVLLALSSILGGAVGNLLDRLFRGAVTDFVGVYIGSYRWPDFNVADSAISIGIVLLLLDIVLPRRARSESTVLPHQE